MLSVAAAGQLQLFKNDSETIIVQWPNSPGLTLESTAHLEAGSWKPVTTAAGVQDGLTTVTLPAPATAQFFRLRLSPVVSRVETTSPLPGEVAVSVYRETAIRLSSPLAPDVDLPADALMAQAEGRRLLGRTDVSADRRTLTLFHLEPLPGGRVVTVRLAGGKVPLATGTILDGDGNGEPGGDFVWSFETSSNIGIPNTAVVGRVFASEFAPDGTGTNQLNRPLAGVTITVDGAEESLRAVTDPQGNFRLSPAPAGEFFVHVDGRTALGSSWPSGAYYPVIGKRWKAVAGSDTNLAGGNGEIFLPRVPADALRAVSATTPTTVTFSSTVLAQNPRLSEVSITVPANGLVATDGTRGGRVGLAPVPPDRLPEPLPVGLDLPLVITVQTDGPTNFDPPVPVRFPNLPDPRTGRVLPPGAKTALWSFDHDTGRWEIAGPATISADGRLAVSDPGVGIRQPGWHGVAPGTPARPSPELPGPERDFFGCPLTNQPTLGDVAWPALEAIWDCGGDVTGLAGVIDGLNATYDAAATVVEKAVEAGTTIASGGTPAVIRPVIEIMLPARDALQTGFETALKKEPLGLALSLLACSTEFQKAYGEIICQLTCLDGSLLCDSIETLLTAEDDLAEFARDTEGLLRDLPITALNFSTDQLAAYFGVSNSGTSSAVRSSRGIGRLAQDPPILPLITNVEAQASAFATRLSTNIGAWTSLHSFFATNVAAIKQELEKLVWSDRGYTNAPFRIGPIGGPWTSGVSSRHGRFDFPILQANTVYALEVFDLAHQAVARVEFTTAAVGEITAVPAPSVTFLTEPARTLDSDGDGLADLAEAVVGTHPALSDTDGDGLSDQAEVLGGTDPLGNQTVATGVIASARLRGEAVDVAAEGSLVAVADSSGVLPLFNVLGGMSPALVAQVPLPERALAVAIEANRVAVAVREKGALLFDLSRLPELPVIRAFQPGGSTHTVELAGGILYVLTDRSPSATTLYVLNARTGELMASQAVPRTHALGFDGPRLVLREDDRLSLRHDFAHGLDRIGQLNLPFDNVSTDSFRQGLSVGDGVAYVGFAGGFWVADISDPASPRLAGQPPVPQVAVRGMAATGAGRMVALTVFGGTELGSNPVSLYDVSQPTNTTRFLASFETPGTPRGVVIENGRVFVADSDGDLQVMNVTPVDLAGRAPTIRLSATFALNPPAAAPGNPEILTARVTDDVQVRAVDFYQDGRLVRTDGSFPFEYRFVTPVNQPTTTLRARAVDMAGNAAWSEPVSLSLDAALTPLRWLGGTLFNGAIIQTPAELTFLFTRPIRDTSIPGGLVISGPAGDVSATARVTVTPAAVILSFAEPLPEGSYRYRLTQDLRDLADSPLVQAVSGTFVVVSRRLGPDRDRDGVPDDLEASLGLNPDQADTDGDQVLDGRLDSDRDGLAVYEEVLAGTNPTLPDTDQDGVNDGAEIASGCSPITHDWVALGGRVVHSTGAPIAGADVYLDGQSSYTVRANERGQFLVANVRTCPASNYLIRAQVDLGGTNYTGSVNVVLASAGTNLIADLVLTAQTQGLPFAPLIDFPAQPGQVVVGDFDLDGRSDLVVGFGSTRQIRFLPGRGEGRFGFERVSTLPHRIDEAVAGDIDGDGRLEIVTMESTFSTSDDTVTVSRGLGGGLFGDHRTYVVGPQLAGLSLLRLGTNPLPSVVTGTRQNRTGYLLRNQNGILALPVDRSDARATVYRTVADINQDGWEDYIFLNRTDRQLGVQLGGTNGPQAARMTAVPSSNARNFVVGDFTGDGRADVVLRRFNSDEHWFYLGNGDGTFRLTRTNQAPALGERLLAGDFDDDGRLDFASAGTDFSGGTPLRIFRGRGDGSFEVSPRLVNGELMAIGDFNGDQRPDLVYRRASALGIALNQGGRFPGLVADGATTESADADGDGRIDLFALGSQGVVLHRALGGRMFAAPTLVPDTAGISFFRTGDVNGDGRADLLLNVADDEGSRLVLRIATAGGGFGPDILIGDVPTGLTRLVDLTGDGRADLVTSSAAESGLLVQAGRTDGTFGERRTMDFRYPVQAEFGDVNGDGIPDAIIASGADFGEGGQAEPQLLLYEGVPVGGFSSSPKLLANATPAIALGDLNGDGLADLLLDGLQVRLAQSGGEFGSAQSFSFPEGALLEDLDGDGRAEVVVADETGVRILP